MNRVLLLGLLGALLGGGLGVLIASGADEGEIFIASDQPVTVGQAREKLQSEGWTNLQVTEHGRYLEVIGSKDSQATKMLVDTVTGRLIADDDYD